MKRREFLKNLAVLPVAGVVGSDITDQIGRDGVLVQIDCIASID